MNALVLWGIMGACGFFFGRWVPSRASRRILFAASLVAAGWILGLSRWSLMFPAFLAQAAGLGLARKMSFSKPGSGKSSSESRVREQGNLGSDVFPQAPVSMRSPEDALRDLMHAGALAVGAKSLSLFVWEQGPEGPHFRLEVSTHQKPKSIPEPDPGLARRLLREMTVLQARDKESGNPLVLIRAGVEGSSEGFLAALAAGPEGFSP